MNTIASLRQHWLWVVGSALCVVLGAVLLRAWFQPPATAARPKDIENAKRMVAPEVGEDFRIAVPQGDYVGGNGVVEPAGREVQVAADVPGRIGKILVEEGGFVEAGQLLVELEHATESAALAATEAELDAAQAELLRAAHGNRREDIRASIADAEAATARAELSAGVLSRYEAVVSAGGVTIDELERARKQADADRAAAEQAAARRDATVEGSRREDIQAARARMMAAQARRDQARAAVELRLVRAPIDAEVLQNKYRIGEYYQPGSAQALMIIGDTRTMQVRMDVDERDIAKIKLGAKAVIRVPAYPGVDFRGAVVKMGRRMGRKNIQTDNPTERTDMKILEAVLELEDPGSVVVGQRVMVYVAEQSS